MSRLRVPPLPDRDLVSTPGGGEGALSSEAHTHRQTDRQSDSNRGRLRAVSLFRVWPGPVLQNRVQTSLISGLLWKSVAKKHTHTHKNTHSRYCCKFTTGHFITTPTTLFLYSQSSVRFYLILIYFFCLWMWTWNLFFLDVPVQDNSALGRVEMILAQEQLACRHWMNVEMFSLVSSNIGACACVFVQFLTSIEGCAGCDLASGRRSVWRFSFFQVYFYPAKKGRGAFIALLLGMFARECHVFESSSFVYPCLVTSKLSNSVDGCSSSRMGLPEKKTTTTRLLAICCFF